MPGPSVKQESPGDKLASADLNAWVIPVTALKTGDTNRTSTSNAPDPDLQLPLLANATYAWELELMYLCTAGNLIFTFAVPGGATCRYGIIFYNLSNSLRIEYHLGADGMGASGANSGPSLTCDGLIGMGTSPGTLQLSWSSSTGSSTATTQHGSHMMAWRVG